MTNKSAKLLEAARKTPLLYAMVHQAVLAAVSAHKARHAVRGLTMDADVFDAITEAGYAAVRQFVVPLSEDDSVAVCDMTPGLEDALAEFDSVIGI